MNDRHALLVGRPDPQLCFDLQLVVAAAGERPQAAERYRHLTELDTRRADAWNKLGAALG